MENQVKILGKNLGEKCVGKFTKQWYQPYHSVTQSLPATEQTDREAQAHTAIVFLAPIGKYFAALGAESLAPLSNLN